MQTQVRGCLAGSLVERGKRVPSMGVGRAGEGSGLKGGLGGLPTVLMVPCAGCMCSALLLLLPPQKRQLGFWSFCILFMICPVICACWVALSLLQFPLYVVALSRWPVNYKDPVV